MRYFLVLLVGIVFAMISCAAPPQVAQGKVVRCDEANATVTIQDQEKPGRSLEFSFGDAEVGAIPHPGDTIRVAYRIQDGRPKATRIMNISRQKELKKK